MGNMEGKMYLHPRFGKVRVIIQPNYKAGGPRNVLVQQIDIDEEVVVPQRSLRVIKAEEGTG